MDQGFTSNKPTHYLQDHGDFMDKINTDNKGGGVVC